VLTKQQESIEGVINFPEDEPSALEALIKLMYGYWYTPPVMFPQTYELAQKYQLPNIAKRLKETFREWVRNDMGCYVAYGYWDLAKDLYGIDDYLPEIRAELVLSIYEYARILEEERDKVKNELLRCPGLAVDLVLLGWHGYESLGDK